MLFYALMDKNKPECKHPYNCDLLLSHCGHSLHCETDDLIVKT